MMYRMLEREAVIFCSWYCLTILAIFDIMQAQVEIAFDQLVQIAKKLPAKQWTQLKAEVENQSNLDTGREEFKKLLLNGPTFSKKQLSTIAETRKVINQWRTK